MIGKRQARNSVTTLLVHAALLLALLVTSGCAWLHDHQRQIIYRPTSGMPAEFAGLRTGDERYFLSLPNTQPAQNVAVWWLPSSSPDAPTLLYLHGTFRNLFQNLHKIESLRAAGYAVLAVDYRGWGESSPLTPSESSIRQDAERAWAELKKRQPAASQRVIYGHSMGSGVAVDLASRLSPGDFGGLVLESAFTSFGDVARTAGWLASLLNVFSREQFDSIGKISRIKAPLLMLHGERDTTIPIQLGERLFAAANAPKQWLTIAGATHSNLAQANPALYQAALRGFAASYLSGPKQADASPEH